MKLAKYAGKQGYGEFREMTLDEVKALSYGNHVWVLSNSGDARQVKINGAVRLWKRDLNRIEVPIKYGLYEYATFNQRDLNRLLVEIEPLGSSDKPDHYATVLP